MNDQPQIRPEVVSQLLSVKADEPLPDATETERQAARDYLVRAINYNEEMNAARRRVMELLTLYGYLCPEDPTVGDVMDLMPGPVAQELDALLERTEPDASY